MAKERQSFVFRYKWAIALSAMPETLRLKTYDAITKYALYGEMPSDENIKYGIFLTVKQEMDADTLNYEKRAAINREIGKKGGRPKKPIKTHKNPLGFEKPDYDSDYDNDYDGDNDSSSTDKKNNKGREDNSRPSLDEIEKEASIKGYTFSPTRFFEYYQERDWKCGDKPITDWKLKMKDWQSRESNSPSTSIASNSVREIVAKVTTIGGKPYVEQYGMRIALPSNYPPQPDVNYYWDEMWNNWRQS